MIISSSLYAQEITDELPCGDVAVYNEYHDERICYDKSEYPSFESAQKAHHDTYFAKLTCHTEGGCDEEIENPTCSPFIGRAFLIGKLFDHGTKWCTNGTQIRFRWECTECIEIIIGEPEILDLTDKDSNARLSLAPLQILTPNPSEGLFHFQMVPPSEKSQLTLSVHDFLGQLIYHKSYWSAPSTPLAAQVDLSNSPSGLYILSLRADGQLLASRQLQVNR